MELGNKNLKGDRYKYKNSQFHSSVRLTKLFSCSGPKTKEKISSEYIVYSEKN